MTLPTDPAPLEPLDSPMPRSDHLDREEPEIANEADIEPDGDAEDESVAGEEDPGAGLDAPDQRPEAPGSTA